MPLRDRRKLGYSSPIGQAAEIMSASATALVGGVKSTFLVATAIVGLSVIAALFELQQHVFGGKKDS